MVIWVAVVSITLAHHIWCIYCYSIRLKKLEEFQVRAKYLIEPGRD